MPSFGAVAPLSIPSFKLGLALIGFDFAGL
jgi:hypothetical protein